jgi:SAM-dependent methyltransferase
MDLYDPELYDRLWSQEWQTLQAIGPLTHNRYRLMLRELPPSLPPGSRIIDVGCGNGSFLEILRKRYPEAVLCGVEYSQQGRQAAIDDIRKFIQVGDIVEVAPRLATEPYDIVICTEVLEHLPDPRRALDAIVSLLKPGGLALLTVPGGMRYWSKQDEAAGHYLRFEYDEFASLVNDSGLQIEQHYGWGGPFGLIYYHMISLVGPDRVMRTGDSLLSRIVSKMLLILFRFDDFFCSRYGFQLVTKARRS